MWIILRDTGCVIVYRLGHSCNNFIGQSAGLITQIAPSSFQRPPFQALRVAPTKEIDICYFPGLHVIRDQVLLCQEIRAAVQYSPEHSFASGSNKSCRGAHYPFCRQVVGIHGCLCYFVLCSYCRVIYAQCTVITSRSVV